MPKIRYLVGGLVVFGLLLIFSSGVKALVDAPSPLVIELDDSFNMEQRQLLQDWLHDVASAVKTVYGEWPQAKTLVHVESHRSFGWGKRSPVPWGQVIRGARSDDMDTVRLLVDLSQGEDRLRADWTAYHEFAHLLIPYRRGSLWFSEGLASYYQNIIQARSGKLSETQMWQKVYDGFQRAKAQNRRSALSLDNASKRRGQFMRMHWHGVLYWLELDVRLRRDASAKARSLDEALLNLKRCCADQSLTPRQLAQRLDEVNGTEVFSSLFEQYRRERYIGDYQALLASVGVRIVNRRVVLSDNAEQRRISKAIFSDNALQANSVALRDAPLDSP